MRKHTVRLPSFWIRPIQAFLVSLVLSALWIFVLADAANEYRDTTGGAWTSSSTTANTHPTSSLENGKYLMRIGNCAACHTVTGGEPFAGGRAIDTPFGAVLSTNITPDPTQGIGRWTSDDFWRAMHHGKSKDGRRLSPAFPFTSFTQLSREDTDAIFSYLQAQKSSSQANAPSPIQWPFHTQPALAVWRSLYFSPGENTHVALQTNENPTLIRGAYLVHGLGHCTQCHGTRNALGGLISHQTLAGAVLPGKAWYAPSLTNTKEAGPRSIDETASLLLTGADRQGLRFVSGPMAEVVLHSSQYLRESDARAIALYLQSLASLEPPSPRNKTVESTTSVSLQGAKIYDQNSVQCHGKHGEGIPNAYPALAGNRMLIMAHPNNAVLSVLHGGFAPSTQANPRPYGMPPYLLQLTDADISSVLSFVRASWGNSAAPITELEVHQIRKP